MTKKTKKIYLDYAATTPISPSVLKEMEPYLKERFGNPSSIHSFGQEARVAVDKAREKIAVFLNCSPSEIFFTGSATEADNLAVFGIVKAAIKKGVKKPHIITSQIEHQAVLKPFKELEKQGVEADYLPVNNQGLIDLNVLKKAIKPNTVLVSTMYANNEIGAIQPLREIAEVIRNFKKIKSPTLKSGQIQKSEALFPFFHTDAVQAVNYLSCDVKKLGVDLLTLSGHKIYGPKGIGALYVRKGTLIEPIIFGGGQENGLRSGTENTASIVGLAKAIEESGQKMSGKIKRIKGLRDRLLNGIIKTIPGARLNGSREFRLPNNINISIPGIEGESMIIALDQEGIAASTGSACSSKTLRPSHVLLALGLPPEQAHGSLRFSLGKYTTKQEIDRVLSVLPKIVERLRKISPFKQQ